MPRTQANPVALTRRSARTIGCALADVGLLVLGGVAQASTSHAGWPPIQHLYQNRTDANATVHGVPNLHNELLGGNGSDTLYAGNVGDVLWGDYKPGLSRRRRSTRCSAARATTSSTRATG